jgi:sigma-B regulation protein RsbU (phosphoserine phosphatase)
MLATLYEIGNETSSILDLDDLLQRVAEVVKRVIDYESFGILLVDEETNELVVRKAVAYAETPGKPRIPLGKGLTGIAAATKEPILVGDVREDPRYLNLIPQTRSELVVPLVYKEKVLGVFDLESPEVNRFTDQHLKILTLLASQIAVAIENARSRAHPRRRAARPGPGRRRRTQGGLFPERCPADQMGGGPFVPRPGPGRRLTTSSARRARASLAVGDVAGRACPAPSTARSRPERARGIRAPRFPPAAPPPEQHDAAARMTALLHPHLRALRLRRPERRDASPACPSPPLPEALGLCANDELPGLPLGAFDGSTYDEKTLELQAGDVLVFYTDGVTEAWNGREQYGAERLIRQVETHAALPAGKIGDRILSDVGQFEGAESPADDITLVVVKLK